MSPFYLLCLCICALDGTSAIQIQGYKYYQEIDGWLRLHLSPRPWDFALNKCYVEGGVLASPTSETMLAAMKKSMDIDADLPCGAVHTGIHSTYTNGEYFTLDGTPLHKIAINWPTSQTREAWVSCNTKQNYMSLQRDGMLQDVPGNEHRPFICYIKNDRLRMPRLCRTADAGYSWDANTRSCYKFHRNSASWNEAAKICAVEGGHLAIINDPIEAMVINEMFLKNPPSVIKNADNSSMVMLGFLNWAGQGIWTTIHGQTLEEAGYATWHPDSRAVKIPDSDEVTWNRRLERPWKERNTDTSDCGATTHTIDQLGVMLYDVDCNETNLAFICEITPDALYDLEIVSENIKDVNFESN